MRYLFLCVVLVSFLLGEKATRANEVDVAGYPFWLVKQLKDAFVKTGRYTQTYVVSGKKPNGDSLSVPGTAYKRGHKYAISIYGMTSWLVTTGPCVTFKMFLEKGGTAEGKWCNKLGSFKYKKQKYNGRVYKTNRNIGD